MLSGHFSGLGALAGATGSSCFGALKWAPAEFSSWRPINGAAAQRAEAPRPPGDPHLGAAQNGLSSPPMPLGMLLGRLGVVGPTLRGGDPEVWRLAGRCRCT